MVQNAGFSYVRQRYQERLGASVSPGFASYFQGIRQSSINAALGYRRAGDSPLFLEAYLDQPIEHAVSAVLGRSVCRTQIVEIGNFAADNAMTMIALWGQAANDLGSSSEVAVATLTAPLRGMFARIGVPILPITAARPERLGELARNWGRYYELDPQVCAGVIGEGQSALAAFRSRRQRSGEDCA